MNTASSYTEHEAHPQAALKSQKSTHKRRWLRWLGLSVLALLMLAILLSGFVALIAAGVDVFKLASRVETLRFYGAAMQVVAVAAIGLRWQSLARWGLRRGFVRVEEFDRLLAYRPKAMAFFVAYLLLVPIGPLNLARLFGLG